MMFLPMSIKRGTCSKPCTRPSEYLIHRQPCGIHTLPTPLNLPVCIFSIASEHAMVLIFLSCRFLSTNYANQNSRHWVSGTPYIASPLSLPSTKEIRHDRSCVPATIGAHHAVSIPPAMLKQTLYHPTPQTNKRKTTEMAAVDLVTVPADLPQRPTICPEGIDESHSSPKG